MQEVFVECFRRGGALERVDRDRDGGFRAFLYGVARNVARRVEGRKARRKEVQAASARDLDRVETDDLTLSRAFDRAWALALLQEALRVQSRRAKSAGEAALRRIELLRLRFQEDLPIRDIAARWNQEAAQVHEDYRTSRREFKRALEEVVLFHHPGPAAEVERECADILTLVR